MTDRPDTTAHAGEEEARARFSGGNPLDEGARDRMVRDHITPQWAAFMEAQPFFFIATADAGGSCDAGYRGREYDLSGKPRPLLKVLDERRVLFPDFSGNKLFMAFGNLLENPHIGMLFIDFSEQRRLRVNGRAEILDASSLVGEIWPNTSRGVMVSVEEAFGNCRARIPKMQLIDPDPFEGC